MIKYAVTYISASVHHVHFPFLQFDNEKNPIVTRDVPVFQNLTLAHVEIEISLF